MQYNKTIMKKISVLIGIFILSFSVIFLCVSPEVKAAPGSDIKKDLDSILHLKAISSPGQGNDPGNEKDRGSKPLGEVRVPLSKDLNAFLGLNSTANPDLKEKDNVTDLTTFFGLRIPLN
jgi:hypothetical protein